MIGLASCIITRYFSTTIKEKYGYDDSLDVFGVHGVGGFVGTLLAAVFCSAKFGKLLGSTLWMHITLPTMVLFMISICILT